MMKVFGDHESFQQLEISDSISMSNSSELLSQSNPTNDLEENIFEALGCVELEESGRGRHFSQVVYEGKVRGGLPSGMRVHNGTRTKTTKAGVLAPSISMLDLLTARADAEAEARFVDSGVQFTPVHELDTNFGPKLYSVKCRTIPSSQETVSHLSTGLKLYSSLPVFVSPTGSPESPYKVGGNSHGTLLAHAESSERKNKFVPRFSAVC